MFKSVATTALLCLTLANCTHSGAPSDIASGQQAWENAFNAQSGEQAAAVYTADAKIYPPNRPTIEGREAVVGFWRAVWDAGVHSLDLEILETKMAGNIAVEVGTYAVKHPGKDGGDDVVSDGRTLVVWERGEDGVWRMSHDMWSDDSSD